MNNIHILQLIMNLILNNDYQLAHSISLSNGSSSINEIIRDFDLEWYYGEFKSELLGVQLLELDRLQLDMELQQSVPNLDEIITQRRIELIFNN